jgi:hypothetical protein
VRLDHLLSKEHHSAVMAGMEPAPPDAVSECGGGVLIGGDTGKSCSPATANFPSTVTFGGVERCCGLVRLVGCGVDTLLSPERTNRCAPGGVGLSLWVRDDMPGMALSYTCCRLVVCGAACGVVGWLFVEICIVDASIFVVKLSRANGGCLGTRSR